MKTLTGIAFPKQIMDVLGIPTGCSKFVLTVEVGEPVEVVATYFPIEGVFGEPTTQKFRLVEITTEDDYDGTL